MNRKDIMQAALDRSIAANDAVFHTALSIARVAELTDQDVPRMCVAAACRMLETQIERYHRGLTGDQPFTDDEKRRLRATITHLAADLEQALNEGLTLMETFKQFAKQDAPPEGTKH